MDIVTDVAEAPKTMGRRSTFSLARTPWDSGFAAAQFSPTSALKSACTRTGECPGSERILTFRSSRPDACSWCKVAFSSAVVQYLQGLVFGRFQEVLSRKARVPRRLQFVNLSKRRASVSSTYGSQLSTGYRKSARHASCIAPTSVNAKYVLARKKR